MSEGQISRMEPNMFSVYHVGTDSRGRVKMLGAAAGGPTLK